MKKSYVPLPIIQGTTGIIAQLIILRELPQVFYGNELSLGFILTAWLFWAAIGSGLIGRRTYRIKSPAKAFVNLTVLSFFVSLILVVGIRYLRSIFDITPGEIVSIPFIFFISNAVVFPLALLQGILFTVLIQLPLKTDLPFKTNTVYILESAGALCGCLFAYLFAFDHFHSLQTLFFINTIRFACIIYFLFSSALQVTIKNKWLIICSMIFCVLMLPNQSLNKKLHEKAYDPFSVINATESKYGSIIQTQQGSNSVTFFENGLNLFTTDDQRSNEESTQFALLTHPEPRHVLLLGGGINGCIKYIRMHQTVETITYVELDPNLIRVALETLPPDRRRDIIDPKVKLVFQDARSFLEQNHTQYDVIISYLPKPHTLQMNRFYSLEFFKLSQARLNQNGVFSFTIPSSESFINNEQALLLKSLKETIDTVFSTSSIIPGNTAIFLASNGTLPSLSADFFSAQLAARELELNYVNQYFLADRLSTDNSNYLLQRLTQTLDYRLNFDLKPILYYYSFILWTNVASRGFTNVVTILQNIRPIHLYIIAIPLMLLAVWFIHRHKKKTSILAVTIATVGLTEISLEIIMVLLVQIYLGNIYSFIALIIGGYMGGLTIGAFQAQRSITQTKNEIVLFKSIYLCEFCMCLAPLVVLTFPLIFKHITVIPLIKMAAFGIIMIAIGFIGGMQFPIANTLFLTYVKEQNKEIGSMYGLDLFGSAIGAGIISLFFIPLIGILHTLIFLSLINMFCFIALLTLNDNNDHHPFIS